MEYNDKKQQLGLLRYGDMTIAPTLRNSTTVILYIDFYVTMNTSTSLPRQILEYFIEFANNLAINIKDQCYIDEAIVVGALYLAIVALQKTIQDYYAKFSNAFCLGK